MQYSQDRAKNQKDTMFIVPSTASKRMVQESALPLPVNSDMLLTHCGKAKKPAPTTFVTRFPQVRSHVPQLTCAAGLASKGCMA